MRSALLATTIFLLAVILSCQSICKAQDHIAIPDVLIYSEGRGFRHPNNLWLNDVGWSGWGCGLSFQTRYYGNMALNDFQGPLDLPFTSSTNSPSLGLYETVCAVLYAPDPPLGRYGLDLGRYLNTGGGVDPPSTNEALIYLFKIPDDDAENAGSLV